VAHERENVCARGGEGWGVFMWTLGGGCTPCLSHRPHPHSCIPHARTRTPVYQVSVRKGYELVAPELHRHDRHLSAPPHAPEPHVPPGRVKPVNHQEGFIPLLIPAGTGSGVEGELLSDEGRGVSLLGMRPESGAIISQFMSVAPT
jgi:hypothetical protein